MNIFYFQKNLVQKLFIGGLLILLGSSCGEDKPLEGESYPPKKYVPLTPETPYIKESCEEISEQLNTEGGQRFKVWENYKNKNFKWNLELLEISKEIIGRNFVVKFKCHGSGGYFSNIRIVYPERVKNSLLQMKKGSFYTVTGQLKSYFKIGNGFNALPVLEQGDFLKESKESLKGNPLNNASYITESCLEMSRKLGSDSTLTQFQKKEFLENSRGKMFVWNLEFRKGIFKEGWVDLIAQFRCENSESWFWPDIAIAYPKGGEVEILNMKKGSFYKIRGWFEGYQNTYGVIYGVSQEEMLNFKK